MDRTREEKAPIVSIFFVKTTSSYLFKLALYAVLSTTTVAAAVHTDNRCATLAFPQGIAKASISLSFMMFMTWQTLFHLGLPGLSGPHHSPGLPSS